MTVLIIVYIHTLYYAIVFLPRLRQFINVKFFLRRYLKFTYMIVTEVQDIITS